LILAHHISRLLFKGSNRIVKFEGTILGGIMLIMYKSTFEQPQKIQVEHENRLQNQEESIPKAQV
jgi:hypothetical protein